MASNKQKNEKTAPAKTGAATPPKVKATVPTKDAATNTGVNTDKDSASAPTVKVTSSPVQSIAEKLMDKHGVDEIFENKNGEFFTNKNLAIASENGKIDLVKTHKKQ